MANLSAGRPLISAYNSLPRRTNGSKLVIERYGGKQLKQVGNSTEMGVEVCYESLGVEFC